MDTTHDLQKKKKESELISEKRSPAKPVLEKDEYVANGEVIKMAPDLAELTEFDWDSPSAQGWIDSENKRLRIKFAGMSNEDLTIYVDIRKQILEQNPGMPLLEASEKALVAFRNR